MFIVIELASSNPAACMNENGVTMTFMLKEDADTYCHEECQCGLVVEVPSFAQAFIQ